jgi:hypothetical protein
MGLFTFFVLAFFDFFFSLILYPPMYAKSMYKLLFWLMDEEP